MALLLFMNALRVHFIITGKINTFLVLNSLVAGYKYP